MQLPGVCDTRSRVTSDVLLISSFSPDYSSEKQPLQADHKR